MLYLYCAHRIVRQLFVVIASSPSLVSPHLFVPSTGFRQAEASADSASKPSEYSHSSMRTLPWLSCAINTLRLVQPAVFREWSRSASCSPVGPSTTNEKTTGTTKKDKVNECIHSCDYSHHRQSDNSEDHEDDDDNENDSDGDDDNDNDDSDDDDDEDDDDDDDDCQRQRASSRTAVVTRPGNTIAPWARQEDRVQQRIVSVLQCSGKEPTLGRLLRHLHQHLRINNVQHRILVSNATNSLRCAHMHLYALSWILVFIQDINLCIKERSLSLLSF